MADRAAIIRQIKISRSFGARKPRKIAARTRHPYVLERTYYRALRTYVDLYIKTVKQILIKNLPELVISANNLRPDGVHTDGWVEDVARLIDSITFTFGPQVRKVQTSIEALAKKVSDFNKDDIERVFRSVLGVNVFTSEPWLKEQLDAFVSQNDYLIKNLPEKATQQIKLIAQKGLANGDTAATIAEQIQKEFGITKRRAQFIARDQVASFNGTLTKLRQTNAGITHFTWRTSLDERVRDLHKEREGEVFAWDYVFNETPDDGPPGIPINCFPGNLKFKTFNGVNKMFRHFYSGHLTKIVTDQGLVLEATPNHPILTDRGWIAIQDINIGDYIFSAEKKAIDAVKVNINERLTFEDSFNSLNVLFGSVSSSSSLTDFHGDMTDTKVDVIELNCTLPDEIDSKFIHDFSKLMLTWANVPDVASHLLADSGILSAFKGMLCSPYGILRSFGQLFTLLNSGESHSVIHSLRSISGCDSVLDKVALYDVSGNIVSFSQLIDAEFLTIEQKQFINRQIYSIMNRAFPVVDHRVDPPTPEKLTQIIGIDAKPFSNIHYHHAGIEKGYCVINKFISEFTGHVYNLETECGYYTVERNHQVNTIVSNCRCTAEPVLTGLLEEI